MPVIFIHGVNTRDGPEYQKNLAARDELLRRLVLEPLGKSQNGTHFRQMEIVSPYWGDHGVVFHWNLLTVPETSTIEHLGPGDSDTPMADIEFTEMVKQLAGDDPIDSSFESLGPGEPVLKEGVLRRAAEQDLHRFIEAVLAPIILSETDLATSAATPADKVGIREALLVVAGGDLAADPSTEQAVASTQSDREMMELLRTRLEARFKALLEQSPAAGVDATPTTDDEFETLGPGWFDALQRRVGELFERAQDAPKRAASLPLLDRFRAELHRNFAQFFGDVFVYLDERGTRNHAGPIVSTVLEAIKRAQEARPHEPLIVITHSMGGNIFYDILTHYAPDLKVDFWVSVGGQVGQFEEMKIFKASKKDIKAPNKVPGLKPRVANWLNIYDPADPFGFKVAPVFTDGEDKEFLTGSSVFKSHSDYFKRGTFYELLRDRFQRAFT